MRRPSFIARQAGLPNGFIGRALLSLMSRETARFNGAVLDALAPHNGERILEVGFGHGRTLLELARRAPGAQLAGIDMSATATHTATRSCRGLIADGQLELTTGDVTTMPWEASTFEAAFSVHAIYFWPEPSRAFADVARVLRPEGRFVLGMRERSEAAVAAFPAHTYHFYSGDEVSQLLAGAGFVDIEIRSAATGQDLRIIVARVRG